MSERKKGLRGFIIEKIRVEREGEREFSKERDAS